MQAIGDHLVWIPLLILAVVLVIVFVSIRTGLRSRGAFRDAASALGLEWSQNGLFGPGDVSGVLGGEQIDIFIEVQGGGTSFERKLTVVEVDLVPPLKGEFRVGRETILNRIAHRFGRDDLQFDDPEFDRIFRIEGTDLDRLGRVFNPATRAALVELAQDASEVAISPARIRWEHSGRVLDEEVLIHAVKTALDAVRSMRMLAA